MGDKLVRSSVGNVTSGWCALPAIGTSIGILLALNPNVVRKKDMSMGVYSISIHLEDILMGGWSGFSLGFMDLRLPKTTVSFGRNWGKFEACGWVQCHQICV